MSNLTDGPKPFEKDVATGGTYQYTHGAIVSARMANERYSQMVLSAMDYRGKTVVDMGSGDGTYTAELANVSGARSVLGVEPSPVASKRSADVYSGISPNLSFVCGDSQMLVDQGKHFDVAVYRGVLHHVSELEKELNTLVCLADVIVILEPNGWNPILKIIEKVSPYHRSHGEKSYKPEFIASLIRKFGGRMVSTKFFGLVPCFCPDIVAAIGKKLEPAVEKIRLARRFLCGQYLMVVQGKPR